MTYSNASALAGPVRRTLAAFTQTAALAAAFALGSATLALAQQPAPAAKPKPPAAAAKKPAAPAQAPAAQPAPAQQAQQPAQGGDQQVQLIYSPWTKFCLKGEGAEAKQVCFTGKDARIESGMPVLAAVLIEPEGEPKKILRVTLPLGMQLVYGTRVIVDQNQPMTAPYVICFTNGCMADYEATADLITKMKSGQGLVVQAFNSTGQPISLVLPLAETPGGGASFAKAYDGPPTDPKVFEEQQKKLQDELQHRAEEARKKLEQQQGGAPGAASSAPQAGK